MLGRPSLRRHGACAGLDSLGSVELVNVLNQRLSVSLPATLTYNHPSIVAIAAHLASLQAAAGPRIPSLQGTFQSPASVAFIEQEVLQDEHRALALGTIPKILTVSMADESCLQGAAIMSSSAVSLMGGKPGLDCLGLVPLQRWDVNDMDYQQMGRPVRFGAFMEHVDQFDNSLFGCAFFMAELRWRCDGERSSASVRHMTASLLHCHFKA